jgi:type IV secretion system protein TrbL
LLAVPAPEAVAQAACPIGEGGNPLDCVIETFRGATQSWETELARLAMRLFWLLAAIEFTWAAISMALRGADFAEWMAGLLNQVMFIGFFAALLQFSSEWAGIIVASFREAANLAGGAAVIKPSDIFDVGVKLSAALLADLSILNLAFSLVVIVAGFFLLIAFALIAATLIVALVESYIVSSAGVLMMGFGGSRWTKDYAIRTFQYCLSVGAKLVIVQLLAGLMITLTEPWTSVLAGYWTRSWSSLFVLLGISLVFVSLIRTIPEMVQALINGTSLASGSGLYGAATGLAAGAAIGAASGGMAVHSAGKLASEQLKEADSGSKGPQSLPGRVAFLARNATGNAVVHAAGTLGDRLSGRSSAHGTRLGQMAGRMDRQREALAEKRAKAAGDAGVQNTAPSPPSPVPETNSNANDNDPAGQT